MFENFGYNKMPLTLLGCDVQLHEDDDKRGALSPHTADVWHQGTFPDYYRSLIIYIKGINANRISETVFFKHKYLANKTVTHTDKVVDAARALCGALGKKKRDTQQQHIISEETE